MPRPVRFYGVVAGIGPRATPTIHEGRVYALGALGQLICLDGATGKPIWQHDVVDRERRQSAAVGQKLLAAGATKTW